MKMFLPFVKKEFRHILRDRRTLLIVIMIPVIQMILFGFALTNEVKNIDVVIYAPNMNEDVRKLANKIDADSYFTFAGYVSSTSEANQVLRRGRANIVLNINPDFKPGMKSRLNDAAFLITVDASDPATATSKVAYMKALLRDFAGIDSRTSINTNVKMLYNPRLLSSYNFVPGLMGLIFMLICAMMTSVSIVREKENGSMEVLLVSPVKPINIVFAKMIPYFVISCVNLACILLLANYMLGVPMHGNIFTIISLSLIYIILSLSFGLLISNFATNQAMAMIFSFACLLFPVIMLSGIIFPVENMPSFFQTVSCIVPARWFIHAIRKLMIEGAEIRYVFKDMAILLLMTLFIIVVAVRKFKNRL